MKVNFFFKLISSNKFLFIIFKERPDRRRRSLKINFPKRPVDEKFSFRLRPHSRTESVLTTKRLLKTNKEKQKANNANTH